MRHLHSKSSQYSAFSVLILVLIVGCSLQLTVAPPIRAVRPSSTPTHAPVVTTVAAFLPTLVAPEYLEVELVEEAQEVAEASEDALVTELADLYEVIDALVAANNLELTVIREVQRQRHAARGGFEKRLRLLWTDDN